MIGQNNFTLKQVALNGQVCIGKEYGGKQIQISKLDDGTLLIKPGHFIPDSELWLYKNNNIEALNKAIAWAETHERRDNFDEIVSIIEND
jgi:hypothetical protein